MLGRLGAGCAPSAAGRREYDLPARPPHARRWPRGLALALLTCAALGRATDADAFQAGGVYWGAGSCGSPCGVFEVTGGGGLGAGALLAATSELPGQIAWIDESASLHVSEFGLDRIVAIAADGTLTTFASGIDGVTGLIRTGDGRLLAASFRDGSVVDVTAGGDFSGAAPFASGLARPRNLLQLASGRILVADQSRGRIVDITGGGDFDLDPGFAWGFASGPFDLVQDAAGRILASSFDGVFDVSAGGDVSGATPFAAGREFIGLAVDGQERLLASVFDAGEVFDIGAGGDFSGAAAFAWGLPGLGDTALDAIPGAAPDVPAALPAAEGWPIPLLAVLLLAAARRSLGSATRA